MLKSYCSLLLLIVGFGACRGTAYKVDVGPLFAVPDGELALQNANGTLVLGNEQNSLDNNLGVGDRQASPYLRLQTDYEKHRVRLHGFVVDSDGGGTLAGDYGGILEGARVNTSMDFFAIAANYGYALLRGDHYRLAIGGQAGFYSLDVTARSAIGREQVNTDVLVPMPFLELEGMLGPVTVGANAAIMALNSRDASGRYWDIEGYVRLQATRQLDVMAGYRYMLIDAYGRATARDFDADIDVQGLFVTAGITF
jgi:hypothetical protein